MSAPLDAGTLACRKYDLLLPSASEASIAITLGDMAQDSPSCRYACDSGATRYGLISILNVPGGPRLPILWSLHGTTIEVTTSHGDREVSDDLRRVIVRLLVIFFHEVREIAPELSALEFTVANDTLLN